MYAPVTTQEDRITINKTAIAEVTTWWAVMENEIAPVPVHVKNVSYLIETDTVVTTVERVDKKAGMIGFEPADLHRNVKDAAEVLNKKAQKIIAERQKALQ